MSELLAQPKPLTARHIVSYFDHEFTPNLSLTKAVADIEEMHSTGFSHMVLCVTESDVASDERQRYLRGVVEQARAADMEVWADPWAVGGVFGGEGKSRFRASGETSCFCNEDVDALLRHWLTKVGEIGLRTVFWDEPELHCAPHRNDELPFIRKYTSIAQDTGFENVVCMCANESKLDQVEEVAYLPSVDEIATDPYFPNAFSRVSEDDRISYVSTWAKRTKAIGAAAGKRSHVWVQTFDIQEGNESMIDEHVQAIRRANMADTALWGFEACKSVPNFTLPGYAPPERVWPAAKRAFQL